MKIHVAAKYPDGSDTFFAPKIKGLLDSRYLIPGFTTKEVEFTQYLINSGDRVQFWLENEQFIADVQINKVEDIEIQFIEKDLMIKINGQLIDNISLSVKFGCYCYGDFVDYCQALCNGGIYLGNIIYM